MNDIATVYLTPALGVAAVDEDGSGGALHAEATREVTAGAEGALVLVRQVVAAGGADERPRGTLVEVKRLSVHERINGRRMLAIYDGSINRCTWKMEGVRS